MRRDFWSFTQSNYSTDPKLVKKETGILWVTISDRVIPYLFKYSVLTFYISVVLVVGRIIRGSTFGIGPHMICK